MRVLGIILIILGLVGLIYGGFTYIQKDNTADLGVGEVSVSDTSERVNIHPAIGGVILAAGIVMLVAGGRKKTEHVYEEKIEIDERRA
ncbi:MAG: hypothetical protein EHM89_20235 [Acidobacteria bacterium]|nr:MAG: hypothetical protein EHM89_20235 [Acidobacteriota bacterium]